jgi:hypothetical protein
MATEDQARKQAPPRGKEGYEHKDANVRSLYIYGLTLAILIAMVMVAMDRTYWFLAKIESLGPPASPFEKVRVLPPQPRLQVQPGLDLKSYCEMEQLRLNTYGWVDQNNGLIHIPVARAMEMVLQRGLPARAVDQTSDRASGDSQAATPAGSTAAPAVMGVAGPCGYLAIPTSAEPEAK